MSFKISIAVSFRQKGNPLLKHIRNVPIEFNKDILVDYEVAPTCGIFFLSLKYHQLHRSYIESRFSSLEDRYSKRILVVLVDVINPADLLRELNINCIRWDAQLILSWSMLEAARYIESFKLCQNTPSTILHGPTKDQTVSESISHVLTAVRGVSKNDAIKLVQAFSSFQKLCGASVEEMLLVPGIGEAKARRIYEVLHTQFEGGSEPRPLPQGFEKFKVKKDDSDDFEKEKQDANEDSRQPRTKKPRLEMQKKEKKK
eukprot:GCRY01000147.1.p1 GENE.GCRY01000147.1~~GCRY01000147.1.p1  ORF type:complete len:258 (-),score=24.04 GCRY01000147.1:1086-1859(-)